MARARWTHGPASTWVVLLVGVLLVGKILLAAQLGLFGDEAFYWQCSQRLEFAYADHPPLTALLIHFGTAVAGHTTLGVRLPFLLLGVLFPFVMFQLALPVVGRSDARQVAAASLVVPALGHMGVVAVPDVPILFFSALLLLGVERASRTGESRYWILAGLAGALGLATHYRFVLAPVSAALFLFLTAAGRQHVRKRGIWIFAAILVTGLVPSILYNVLNDFAPIRYYLGVRHDTTFRLAAVGEFLASQAALATPLLFLALLSALATALRRARAGDSRAQLISVFALLPLGVFLIASPFESSRLVTHHWPMPAYVPLLIYLPLTCRAFVAGDSYPGLRRGLAVLAPGLAAVFLLLVGLELATGFLGTSARRPFVGWSEIASAVERHLDEVATAGRRSDWLVVADNYKLGANLEFETAGRVTPFVLDHEKNRLHGRAPQFPAWHLGEEALHSNSGKHAIVVIQVKEVPSTRRAAWRESVARRFEHFESLEKVRVYFGQRSVRFEVIKARGLRPMAEPGGS